MHSKIKEEKIAKVEITEEIGPPPATINTNFNTLQDWLVNICNSENPRQFISKYEMGYFESPNEYVVYLIGKNQYENEEKIDFKPLNTYFLLPQKEYGKLSREQLLNRLRTEIVEFTKTNKFKESFLAKADSISLAGNTLIWSK